MRWEKEDFYKEDWGDIVFLILILFFTILFCSLLTREVENENQDNRRNLQDDIVNASDWH